MRTFQGMASLRTLLTRPVALPGRQVNDATPQPFRFVDPTAVWPWRLLVVWAAVTVALELMTLATDAGLLTVRTLGQFGTVPLSWATVAAVGGLLLARAGTTGRFGPAWWGGVALLTVLLLPAAWAAYGGSEVAGFVLGSATEEIVYRLALPVVIVAALRTVKVATQPALWVAFVVSTTVFTFLPGHIAQAQDAGTPLMLLVVAAVGVLWFGVVWRGGSIAAAVVCHVLVNLSMLPVEVGSVTPQARTVFVAGMALLAAAGAAYAVRHRPAPHTCPRLT